jgi:hypothetical protein
MRSVGIEMLRLECVGRNVKVETLWSDGYSPSVIVRSVLNCQFVIAAVFRIQFVVFFHRDIVKSYSLRNRLPDDRHRSRRTIDNNKQ